MAEFLADRLDRRPDRVRREVVSFVRRSARMRPAQQRAWEDHRRRYLLEVPRGETSTSVLSDSTLDPPAVFGREAPLVVEIGPGTGESFVPLTQARPDANLLGLEVYQPALATLVQRLETAEVTNARLVMVDAAAAFRHLLPPCSVREVWMFFPDPWHKARHHKRRLLTREFADSVASRMEPNGIWRLATDWADYAGSMRAVLDEHPAFIDEHPGGWAPRWEDRPITRFEQRGLDAGRRIFDLAYRLVRPSAVEPGDRLC